MYIVSICVGFYMQYIYMQKKEWSSHFQCTHSKFIAHSRAYDHTNIYFNKFHKQQFLLIQTHWPIFTNQNFGSPQHWRSRSTDHVMSASSCPDTSGNRWSSENRAMSSSWSSAIHRARRPSQKYRLRRLRHQSCVRDLAVSVLLLPWCSPGSDPCSLAPCSGWQLPLPASACAILHACS